MPVVDVLHHALYECRFMAHSPRWSARGLCAAASSRPSCSLNVSGQNFNGVTRLKSSPPVFIWRKKLRSMRLPWTSAARRRADTGALNSIDDDSATLVAEEESKQRKRAPRKTRKKASPEVAKESNLTDVNYSGHEVRDATTVVATIQDSIEAPKRRRKKADIVVPDNQSNVEARNENVMADANEYSNQATRKGRRKASATNSNESNDEKKPSRRGRSKRQVNSLVDQSELEVGSDNEEIDVSVNGETISDELDLSKYEEEDISYTYSWPPLVCCFGAAQLGFLPSGRPANRLIDYDIYESKKLWRPDKFVRAPGGPSSEVAIALANLGGRAAFMGKIGDDDFGQTLLYHLNSNKVQTRSVKLDKSKATGLSYMKISRRGALKAIPTKACAEDCFVSSNINVDVLKESRMFYFNSSSLLDKNMRSTTFRAIQVAKKFGGLIFFDLNLPLPLWESGDITKDFIRKAWSQSDFIEITKQELEFLCGIHPTEMFDTKDNDESKFVHYRPEIVKPLWHDSLKVLFVTNGTSKIHFYTQKDNGFVRGAEDAPLTPFTCDMSASGDAIVAALMLKLSLEPELATDKGYLRHIVKYASNRGVTNQWTSAHANGFPPKEWPNEDGIRSITEREFRTVVPVGQ